MRISSIQPIQNLPLKKPDVIKKEFPKNLYNKGSFLLPHIRQPLSIIKANKAGLQGWSSLAKLALASTGVIKATTLGYLTYTSNSAFSTSLIPNTNPINTPAHNPATAPDSSTTHNETPINTSESNHNITPDIPIQFDYPSHGFTKLNDPLILNQESESTSSLPLIVTVGTICLFIGGILGSLMSKGKTDDSSYKNDLKKLEKEKSPADPKKIILEEITSLQTEQTEKTKLETAYKDLKQNYQKKQNDMENLFASEEKVYNAKRQKAQLEISELNKKLSQLKTDIAALEEKKKKIATPVTDAKVRNFLQIKDFADLKSEEEKRKKTIISDFKKSYKSLIVNIPEEKESYIKKEKISELTDLLIKYCDSEYAEIQELIFDGFKTLFVFSPSQATLLAIECLEKKSEGCKKVSSETFSWLLTKYFSTIEESNRISILKNALTFAKQCRIKKVPFAVNNIKDLDTVILDEALATLLNKDNFKLAIKFIDFFLDVLNDGSGFSQTNIKFNETICIKLKGLNKKLHKKYLEAQNSDREAFDPKKINEDFFSIIYPPRSISNEIIIS